MKLIKGVGFREILTNLGPSFIKAGQVLANRPDIMRQDFMNELCTLQDDVPSFPDEMVGCLLVTNDFLVIVLMHLCSSEYSSSFGRSIKVLCPVPLHHMYILWDSFFFVHGRLCKSFRRILDGPWRKFSVSYQRSQLLRHLLGRFTKPDFDLQVQ